MPYPELTVSPALSLLISHDAIVASGLAYRCGPNREEYAGNHEDNR